MFWIRQWSTWNSPQLCQLPALLSKLSGGNSLLTAATVFLHGTSDWWVLAAGTLVERPLRSLFLLRRRLCYVRLIVSASSIGENKSWHPRLLQFSGPWLWWSPLEVGVWTQAPAVRSQPPQFMLCFLSESTQVQMDEPLSSSVRNQSFPFRSSTPLLFVTRCSDTVEEECGIHLVLN